MFIGFCFVTKKTAKNLYMKHELKVNRLKIFHGPVNIGGIGGYLASYQREQGHDAQFIVWGKNKFFFKIY